MPLPPVPVAASSAVPDPCALTNFGSRENLLLHFLLNYTKKENYGLSNIDTSMAIANGHCGREEPIANRTYQKYGKYYQMSDEFYPT